MGTLHEDKTLTGKLVKVQLTIKMNENAHVPDTMLLIRCLPTVAICSQSDKVERSQSTGTILDVFVKFLPKQGTLYKNIVDLCRMIKRIPNVKHIKVEKVGNRPVSFKGNPIVI